MYSIRGYFPFRNSIKNICVDYSRYPVQPLRYKNPANTRRFTVGKQSQNLQSGSSSKSRASVSYRIIPSTNQWKLTMTLKKPSNPVSQPRQIKRPEIHRNKLTPRGMNLIFSPRELKIQSKQYNYNLDRHKFLKNIYKLHFNEPVQRSPNIEKAVPLHAEENRTVVHKLSGAMLREQIKHRATLINKRKLKDQLLKPQVFCKKSLSTHLSAQPILPCKNVVNR